MVITEKTTIEELDKFKNGFPLEITKAVALNKELLEQLVTRFPDSEISILSGYSTSQIYSERDPMFNRQELSVLIENVTYLKERYQKEVVFDENISVEQAIVANRKFNNIVDEIQNAKIDGKELSDFEKFVWAYQQVTEKIYTLENEGDSPSKSRNLFEVLSGDKIVCVGYANMLIAICTRLGISCTLQEVATIDPNTNAFGNHATVAIRIDDNKYNIHGIFFCDPTADSARKWHLGHGHTSFGHALIPYSKIKEFYNSPIVLNKSVSTSEFTEPITSAEEVERTGINKPTILANLFPELTNGKTQNQVVREFATKTVADSKIKNEVLTLIDSFDENKIEAEFNAVLQNYVEMAVGGYQPYSQIAMNLAGRGFLREEVLQKMKDLFSKENVLPVLEAKYSKYPEQIKNSSIERDLKKVAMSIKSFENGFEKLKLPESKTTEAELFESLALKITSACASKYFFDKDLKNNFSEFKQLLIRGVSRQQIVEKLKTMCVDENLLTAAFISTHPDGLKAMAETNENELYFALSPEELIFNLPYEEPFKNECKKARTLSDSDLHKALVNIFKAQGLDDKLAHDVATTSLARTRAENQMQ